MGEILTYQDLFSLQNVLLRQLGGRAPHVHRVSYQIRIRPGHQTSAQIVVSVVVDLKVSTWSCSSHLVVALLRQTKKKTERNLRLTIGKKLT